MANLDNVSPFSCYKSLLDLLLMVCEGPNALDDKRVKKSWEERQRNNRDKTRRDNRRRFFASFAVPLFVELVYKEGKGWTLPFIRDRFVQFIHNENRGESERAAIRRREKRKAMKQHAMDLYDSDRKFRQLYDKVADIFAAELKFERALMESGVKSLSGLGAKWAPTVKGSHDRCRTNIVDGIVERLYPDTKTVDFEELRDRYRREYLSPLRRAAKIPESFAGSGEWHLVDYTRMPSQCRFVHGMKVFRKHDQERYDAYLEDIKKQVSEGKNVTLITAGALLPHQLTAEAINYITPESDEDNKRAEELGLQWLRLVQDVKEKGRLPSALAICDVSGSMTGVFMDVAIALSLLIADITEGEFSNEVITFSKNPQLVSVPKAEIHNLAKRVQMVQGMEWGYNTDFQKVFEMLLQMAKKREIPPHRMPSMLFCFSDMEFDCANRGGWMYSPLHGWEKRTNDREWKTDLEQVRDKYHEAGYEVPDIVFWNLRDSISSPSDFRAEGVTMMSGFSAGLMKSFLEFRLERATPLYQMLVALNPYESVVLPDTVDSFGVISELLKRE